MPEGIDARDENMQSEVELFTLDKEGIVYHHLNKGRVPDHGELEGLHHTNLSVIVPLNHKLLLGIVFGIFLRLVQLVGHEKRLGYPGQAWNCCLEKPSFLEFD